MYINASTSSSSSRAGGKAWWIFGIGKEWLTTFAFIFDMPETWTFTIQMLCFTRDISSLSVQLRSCNSGGTSPNHNPLARLSVGILPCLKSFKHEQQISVQLGSRTGPGISVIESSEERRSVLVTGPSGIKGSMSISHSCIDCSWSLSVRSPHTAQADSKKFSIWMSLAKSDIISCSRLCVNGEGGKLTGSLRAEVAFLIRCSCTLVFEHFGPSTAWKIAKYCGQIIHWWLLSMSIKTSLGWWILAAEMLCFKSMSSTVRLLSLAARTPASISTPIILLEYITLSLMLYAMKR